MSSELDVFNFPEDYAVSAKLTDHTIGGKHLIVEFENGYGASVISNQYSYGGLEGLYELGLLHHGSFVYDDGEGETPIGENPVGYLTDLDVVNLLDEIRALPPKTEELR
jgi:hypothetical protein